MTSFNAYLVSATGIGQYIESNRVVFQARDEPVNFMLPVGWFGEASGLPFIREFD